MFKNKLSMLLLSLTFLLLLGIVSFGRIEVPRASAGTDYQELQLFTDVLTIVKRSYVEEVTIKELVYGAIDGMLASLDPHSGFMSPEIYKEMKVDTRGEFGGLGIEISLPSIWKPAQMPMISVSPEVARCLMRSASPRLNMGRKTNVYT